MPVTEDKDSGEEHVGQVYAGEAGSYRIGKIIGAGGMGVVCLGETEVRGKTRQVAVKFLHRELADESESSRERFDREIKVLQDLKAFRGVVQIEDVGRTPDGAIFLVMEFVTGRPLNDIIAENPQGITQIYAIQLVIEILIVLEPIHRTKRFVHRDLKPHNICVYEDPLSMRLLDFGLSKPVQDGGNYASVTRKKGGKANEIPGSPHYMPEEQFLRPREVDNRTDLYAVGIILYELIAGVPPYRGIYLQDILKQHREANLPAIDTTVDGGPVSYRLWSVIETALQKDPKDRFQNATEFREALEDVLKHLVKLKQPKKVLDSAYRLVKKIGEGGNSEVFLAEEIATKRDVALKIAKHGSGDWDEETLNNEADRALKHDNIVEVFNFGLFDDRSALVMEYIPNGTVADLVKDNADGGLAQSAFYRVVIDVCRGLHRAHQNNIVHRDVKPENLLLTAEGRAKVGDFGIAKRFDSAEDGDVGSRNTTLAKGTAYYMSPEQCHHDGRVDRRADIYSLGIVMYELLSGEPPFTEGVLLLQHLQNDPPPLEIRGEFNAPEELAKVVERCLKKDKNERYENMKELAEDIVRVSKVKEKKRTKSKPIPIFTGATSLDSDGPSSTSTINQGLTGEAQTQKKTLIFVVVPLLVAVLGLGVWMAFFKEDKPPVNPTPVVGPETDDAEAIAKQAARDLETKIIGLASNGDWKAIQEADLSAFDGHDGHRDGALYDVQTNVKSALRQVDWRASKSLENANTKFASARAALAHFGDDGEFLQQLDALLAKGAEVGKLVKNEGSFKRVDDDELKSLRTVFFNLGIDGEVEARKKNLREAVEQSNAQVVAASLAKAPADADLSADLKTEILRLETLFSGEALGQAWTNEPRDLLKKGVGQWADRQCAALEDARGIPSLLNRLESLVDSKAAWRKMVQEPSPGIKNGAKNRESTTLSQALAYAVLRFENEGMGDVIAKEFDNKEPKTWPTILDQLKGDGVDAKVLVEPFDEALGRYLTSAMSVAITQRAENAADGGVAIAAEMQAIRSEITSRLSPRTSLGPKLRALVPGVRGEAEIVAQEIKAEIDALDLKDASSLVGAAWPKTLALVGKIDGFVQRNSLDSNNADFVRKIQEIGAALEGADQRLAAIAVFKEAEFAIGDKLDSNIANMGRYFLQRTFDSKALNKASYFEGLASKFANARWTEVTTEAIQLRFALDPNMVTLLDAGSAQFGVDGATVAIEGQELVVSGSPKSLAVTDGDRVKLGLALSLNYGGREVATATETFSPSDAPQLDVAAPTIAGQVDGQSLTVVLTDANGVDAPVVKFGGRTLGPAVSDPSVGTWVYELTLAMSANLGSVNAARATVEAKDAFGNSSSQEIAIGTAFRTLAEAEADKVGRELSDGLAGLKPSVGLSSLSSFASFLEPFSARLDRLKSLNGAATARAVDQNSPRVKTFLDDWIGLQTKGQSLANLRSGWNSAVKTAERFLRKGSSGTVSLTAQRSNFTAKAGVERVQPPDPGPDRTKVKDPVTPTARWSRKSITLGGVTFHRVGDSDRNPAWIADQELSVAFLNAAGVKVPSRSKTKGRQPVCPMSPRDAETIVKALTAKFSSELKNGGAFNAAGGRAPLKIDIPDISDWQDAAVANGGNGFIAPGAKANFSLLRYRSTSKTPEYDRKLKAVGSSPLGGKFKNLAGNVSEIVRRSRGFKTVGGSMQTLSASDAVGLQWLALSSRGRIKKSATIAGNSNEPCSGLRLAIVPAR